MFKHIHIFSADFCDSTVFCPLQDDIYIYTYINILMPLMRPKILLEHSK